MPNGRRALLALGGLVLGMGGSLACRAGESPAPEPAKPLAPAAALRVFVVRHAEAFKNLAESVDLPPEKLDSLTPKGIVQARALGVFLKEKSIALRDRS